MKNMPYKIKIGVECHIQINSNSKLFSTSPNKYTTTNNNFINEIDLGLPGTLPSINKYVVNSALILGHALNASIHTNSTFVRKHYFYPDLPKGYQITQYKKPICTGGYVAIPVKDYEKNIKICRIQIEEDTGKSIHLKNSAFSFLNYNRSGIPLLEVVTEPNMYNKYEVIEFIKYLRSIIMSLNISCCDMEKGEMRIDLNISVSNLNIISNPIEIKNINSIKFLGQAIDYEIQRQSILLEKGIIQKKETYFWNSKKKCTKLLRVKEKENDYRYLRDPDIPSLFLSLSYINNIKKHLPNLPYNRIKKLKFNENIIYYFIKNLFLLNYIESIMKIHNNPHETGNWIINYLTKYLDTKNNSIRNIPISINNMAIFIKLIDNMIINKNIAKLIFYKMIKNYKTSPILIKYKYIIKEKHSYNDNEIKIIIKNILSKYSDEVNRYKNGKTKLIGFFIKEVLMISNHKYNPKTIKNLIENIITSY